MLIEKRKKRKKKKQVKKENHQKKTSRVHVVKFQAFSLRVSNMIFCRENKALLSTSRIR